MASGTIAQQITRLHPDDSGFAAALEKQVEQYPYCSLTHLLLLKATLADDPQFASRAAKTQLHVQQPFLLQFQLNQPWFPPTEALPEPAQPAKDNHPSALTSPSAGEVILSELTAAIEQKPASAENHPTPAEKEPEQPAAMIAAVSASTENAANVLAAAPVAQPAPAEPLLFEPLHTTDYFASQGIRITDEVKSTDKLGTQLRSFTEWLKTMKKVHGSQLPADTGKPLDATVQQLAEKSNVEEDVITESMAEVFVQQGKRAKAIEVYEKLSLQNPAKSAYFAAKIDLIKAN